MILGMMERFNYPNMAAVLAEDASILRMLKIESMGRDDGEEVEIDG